MKSAIVGVGASAGGLEAVSEILGGLPLQPGVAIIVVQHLDRARDSLLAEILGRRTTLPVIEARDGMPIAPDHVYVIPPNATLTVDARVLRLSPRAATGMHMPIDALFRSLADNCGESAVGIVLSGADSDGAAGTQAIKHAGGITFAQDPNTARVSAMPRSAVETGCVDFVLPAAEIARELLRLSHSYLRPADVAEAVIAGTDSEEGDGATEGQLLRRIFRRLRLSHGVDFSGYKPSTLRRRLVRRMAVQRIETLTEYTAFLENDPREAAALYQDFLIRVTSFFRDPATFSALIEHVFPSLLNGRSPKEPIRIWVPGCATGEEVYSIAIALLEYLGDLPPPAGIQIFGTDISEAALEKCRVGAYFDSIAQDVSADRLRRYFVRQNSHYVIARSIRDLCVFARHDITRDPPFSRLDLVSCRNVLIYLGAAVQGRIMQTFRYALRPNGFLLLGPSESIGQGAELFEAVDKQHRLYKPGPIASFAASDRALPSVHGSISASQHPEQLLMETESAVRHADRLLLARYSPAGIVVDDALNILQFRGETAPFLAPASGPPSLNLLRIARPELLLTVPPAVEEARASGKVVRRAGLTIDGAGAVDLEVIPLRQAGAVACYLILLESESFRTVGRRERLTGTTSLTESEKDKHLANLERENLELREFLQATMEQHEAAREELKSAHEEVLSANEEFQSTNEELETSKEELQSANEELITTNDELRERNRQLAVLNMQLESAQQVSDRAHALAESIVETVRQPLVVLDRDLNVMRANRAFATQFGVRVEDMKGASLDVVGIALGDTTLNQRLAAILTDGPAFTDFEVVMPHGRDGRRILSLSARKIAGDADRVELILLAIEDVTEKSARIELVREELVELRRNLAHAGRVTALGELASGLAHELRQPLTAILTDAQAAQMLVRASEPDFAELPEILGEIVRDAQRAAGVIDRLGKMLKRQPMALARLSVEDLLKDVTSLVHGDIVRRGISLQTNLGYGSMFVQGDRVHLSQVLINLLINAMDAVDDLENARRRVVLHARTNAQGWIEIGVADAGPGVPAEAMKKLFEPFFTTKPTGMGMGLAISRTIIEAHDGRLWAENNPETGATFWLAMPAHDEPQAAR
ncbi:chemotaxis protein CheB [Peristeroidobacter agariperforans]|uniref:chemotaxis protein CheB n=1 Tax=Peristeroidobacter agariperforans TaxID=268404 RepID=UPI00101CE9F6|nr:chemotaxis protein CheB [Peristeroidobacter agariperforans]